MKPLIVGEAPSKNEAVERPLEGRVGKRLASYAGLPLEEFLMHFDRVNLLHVRQDMRAKGFEFNQQAAAVEACRLATGFYRDQIVLLLGRRVARAFGIKGDYFVQHRWADGVEVRVLPHPSGVNRWWNAEDNKAQMTRFMRKIVERTT